MTTLHPTEQAVLDLITQEPGIQADEIVRRLGKTKGRISQIVGKLKDDDRIQQTKVQGRRGLVLKPSGSWMRRRLVRMPWSRFREKPNG